MASGFTGSPPEHGANFKTHMIYLATDHRGLSLKEKIKGWLNELGYRWEDMGAYHHDPEDDYPDFVSKAAQHVSRDPMNSKAIILGASGQGEAMVANRFRGVRAAVFYGGPEEIIRLSREHNDANVLSLGAAFVTEDVARKMIELWLKTPFSQGERHKRRIQKIDHTGAD